MPDDANLCKQETNQSQTMKSTRTMNKKEIIAQMTLPPPQKWYRGWGYGFKTHYVHVYLTNKEKTKELNMWTNDPKQKEF